jgi:hypothetical protein
MTYRERRLKRAERLRQWSQSNQANSDARAAAADKIADGIPVGQPILVGHHSERRHRKDLARIQDGMSASVELERKAQAQARAADEIEAQAANAIYDDDPDAIERLSEKIVRLEAEREEMKRANAKYRGEHRDELKAMSPYDRHQAVPYPSWALQNLGGNITRTRERLVRLQREKVTGPRDRVITAKYRGICADCGTPLERGQQIRYNRSQGARCVTCPTGVQQVNPSHEEGEVS